MGVVADCNRAAHRDVVGIGRQQLPTHGHLDRIRSLVEATNVRKHDLAWSSLGDRPVVIGILDRIHGLRNGKTRVRAKHDGNIGVVSLIVIVLVALVEEIRVEGSPRVEMGANRQPLVPVVHAGRTGVLGDREVAEDSLLVAALAVRHRWTNGLRARRKSRTTGVRKRRVQHRYGNDVVTGVTVVSQISRSNGDAISLRICRLLCRSGGKAVGNKIQLIPAFAKFTARVSGVGANVLPGIGRI